MQRLPSSQVMTRDNVDIGALESSFFLCRLRRDGRVGIFFSFQKKPIMSRRHAHLTRTLETLTHHMMLPRKILFATDEEHQQISEWAKAHNIEMHTVADYTHMYRVRRIVHDERYATAIYTWRPARWVQLQTKPADDVIIGQPRIAPVRHRRLYSGGFNGFETTRDWPPNKI